jgi:N-dimethylarginine dimethylaminohydrolase
MQPIFLMVDPAHFEVAYAINPWMSPAVWRANSHNLTQDARAASASLKAALQHAGARVIELAGVEGAPDLVFPANAAVVFDGTAVLARFRHAERQVEEPVLRKAFHGLVAEGVLDRVIEMPAGAVQEGAGDFLWDESRRLFWAGFGPRSNRQGLETVAEAFGRETVPLELATERFYHLDTCFCPLPGGEILYYPPAFTPEALAAIRARVDPADRIEASDEDAARFCVNAVALGRTIVMAQAPDALRNRLEARGYRLVEIDLAPFILSGGGAYCMTLRLDRSSNAARPSCQTATETMS